MKVYLAGDFDRRAELFEVAERLVGQGHDITSLWLWTDGDVPSVQLDADATEGCALRDLRDVEAAQVVVLFTRETDGRGGKDTELGYALGLGKRLVIVGTRRNVFHWLAGPSRLPDRAGGLVPLSTRSA